MKTIWRHSLLLGASFFCAVTWLALSVPSSAQPRPRGTSASATRRNAGSLNNNRNRPTAIPTATFNRNRYLGNTSRPRSPRSAAPFVKRDPLSPQNVRSRVNRSLVGRVVKVRSDQRLDVAIKNVVYNVYATTRIPRGVKQGTVVRIDGVRTGSNDIRNAYVSLLGHR